MVSFYASCIATYHNLDVLKVPIAVVGNLEQKGSVVLAASPPMKKRFSIKTGSRLYKITIHSKIRLFNHHMNYIIAMTIDISLILYHIIIPDANQVTSSD